MLSPEKVADLNLKHLEMVQNLITRMAGYGASFKSYCITVVTAVVGFAITLQRPFVVLLALVPITAFAFADAQYLRIERRFRALYDTLRAKGWEKAPDFAIDLKFAPTVSYAGTLFSWSIVAFYGPLAGLVLVISAIARFAYGAH